MSDNRLAETAKSLRAKALSAVVSGTVLIQSDTLPLNENQKLWLNGVLVAAGFLLVVADSIRKIGPVPEGSPLTNAGLAYWGSVIAATAAALGFSGQPKPSSVEPPQPPAVVAPEAPIVPVVVEQPIEQITPAPPAKAVPFFK